MRATKAIWIEWREPNTQIEKELFGETRCPNISTARIFINTRKHKRHEEAVKTYWHEMFHAFCHFHRQSLTARQEEKMARKFEAIAWELIR